LLVHRDDGIAFAVAGNRRPSGDPYANELKRVSEEGLARVNAWPALDLF